MGREAVWGYQELETPSDSFPDMHCGVREGRGQEYLHTLQIYQPDKGGFAY